MKVKWITMLYGHDTDYKNLYSAIEELGYEVKGLTHVPYEKDSVYPDGSCVLVNGPIFLVQDAYRWRRWSPVAWLPMDLLSCRSYYGYWGNHIFQKEYAMMPLGEVLRKKDWIYKVFGVEDEVFIRPDANNKRFDGEKIYKKNFDLWCNSEVFSVDHDVLCVVAKPRKITTEWRTIVRRGKVIASSSYRFSGELNRTLPVPQNVHEFAEHVVKIPFPELPPIYVVDIALSEGELSVIEIGSVNTCGYYNCDLKSIVTAMSEEAEEENNPIAAVL